LLRNNHFKTPYQLWKGRPASVKHFRIFGSKCYIKRVDKHLGKLKSRIDEGILVGYSYSRKAYKCYNFRLNKIVEAIDVKFDESSILKSKSKQKNHQIYEIDEKHKMNDEVSEIEETKAKWTKWTIQIMRIIGQLRLILMNMGHRLITYTTQLIPKIISNILHCGSPYILK
jgi:hypothetical protein